MFIFQLQTTKAYPNLYLLTYLLTRTHARTQKALVIEENDNSIKLYY